MKSVALRLLERTSVPALEECWEWTGAVTDFGHGRIWVDGRVERTHRLAYRLFTGSIPDGEVVRHRCDNPRCVNPRHLILGTLAENSRDMVRRNRHRSGYAKLTAEDAVYLRERAALGTPIEDLAFQFGISRCNLARLVGREIWKNAEGFTSGDEYNSDVPF
jgi:hypothetical protein